MTEGSERKLRGYEKSLPIALLRAREATMRRFKPHVDAHGLTIQQWRVIRALADSGPLDSKTLAARCVIMPPSLTRIFRALEARGLIRAEEAEDARRHVVALTGEGRALHDRMAGASEAIYAGIEDAFGAEKMAALLALLVELREVAEAMPEEGRAPDGKSASEAARR